MSFHDLKSSIVAAADLNQLPTSKSFGFFQNLGLIKNDEIHDFRTFIDGRSCTGAGQAYKPSTGLEVAKIHCRMSKASRLLS